MCPSADSCEPARFGYCHVDYSKEFKVLLTAPSPVLALAPMQDVTDLPFWRLMAGYGGADIYFTEYFRVHATSNLEKHILKSITENPTGRPIVAQMIGNDIPVAGPDCARVAAISDRSGGPEPRLSRAGRLPQMRRRRSAARTGKGGRHPRRVARGGDDSSSPSRRASALTHRKFSTSCCRFSRSTRSIC